jgi:hypothetical protein
MMHGQQNVKGKLSIGRRKVSTYCWPRHIHRDSVLEKNWRGGEDDIRMDLRTGKDTVQWIRMAQDKKTFRDFVNSAMDFLVP